MDTAGISAKTQEVVRHLSQVFGDILDNEIIQSVAHNCNYSMERATNTLLELVQSTSASQDDTPIHQNTTSFSYSNAIKSQSLKYGDNADVVIESEKIVNSKPSLTNINLHPTKNISVISQRTSRKELEFERVIQHVKQESQILILMRGLPGSGKSYLAKTIVDRAVGSKDYHIFILSTDDYFYNERSRKYIFNPNKLQDAHEWNQQRAYTQMSSGVSPVIIDNTNTQMWEMKCYAMMAANFGYLVEIVEPFTSWAFDIKECASRNKHAVPKTKIQDMLLRYQKDITSTDLFSYYNLNYVNYIPPVKRKFPPTSLKFTVNGEINLIGFDEESIVPDTSNEGNRVNKMNSPQKSYKNLFDSILVDSQQNTDAVLTPKLNNSHSINNTEVTASLEKTSTSINNIDRNNAISNQVKKPKDVYPTLNLSSWGLPPDAVSSWNSWDLVSPLNKEETPAKPVVTNTIESPKEIETSDRSTNTSSHDFALLDTNCLTLSSPNCYIIRATGRDINGDKNPVPPTSPLKKMLLHKSSMTEEEEEDMEHKTNAYTEENIQQLVSLFPTIPIDYLRDVYEKCKENINWACDLLLDDRKEILTNAQPSLCSENVTNYKSASEPEGTMNNLHSKVKQPNHDSNAQVDLEEIDRLKTFVEERFQINPSCYSEHVMKIKNLKHTNDGNFNQINRPSPSCFEVYPTTSGDVIALSTNIDVDDFEPDIDFPECEEVEDQSVEINLGDACINQLESLFGFPEMFPKGFLPVVQVPLELAAQLHAFYVQSVLGQMDTQNNVLDMITKEDEELARKLQNQEELIDETDENKPTNLQDVMKEQVADKMNRKKIDEWKKLTPDTLAAKLTIQKLVTSFPSVDKTVLMEILHAHNNSYVETVEVLLASTESTRIYDPDGTIREPPISDSVINDMKVAGEEKRQAENIPDVSKTACEYREEANNYHKKHNEYMLKAQRAFQNRQYQVAQYYSDLAKDYTRLYEHTNSLAATAFLQEHSSRLQSFNTLDLHYLYVKEAIPALDMFLDSNIRLLQNPYKKTESLFIITGKGNRSLGKARLKPAVMAHLKKRGLQWVVLNPGLLKVKIHPHSATSNNM
ncbi:hypothetical protein FQR65_LT08992 [Abscondita terminalis]|nr:hypothetical protein FQR65_LT08992 [Abscondita terminalis]